MLAGHTPFRSQGKQSMLINISNCKPKFPLTFPSLAKDLISKILIKDCNSRLTVKEILEHPWVKSLPEPKETIRKDSSIPLPQFHDSFYLESIPIEFKCYKVIRENKKIEYKDSMETQSTHTTYELAALGNFEPISSSRKSSHKDESSVSNFTLSDSELVLSDSDISKDMIEETAFRDSIRQLQVDIEGKQASILITKTTTIELNSELKT